MRTFEIIEWVTLASGDTVRRVKETREFNNLRHAMTVLTYECYAPSMIDYRITNNELVAFNVDTPDVKLYIIREYKEI